ncbi:SNF2 family domain-containing protein [Phlyctema vagabunda]|uniref:SNF2 family domain-containing protein n=1 Tax=Phlyctema vagabunda TaxID=108571 RepID=A0ABR4P1K2_9HELO
MNAHSGMASGPEATMSVEELEQEIAFQTVLLHSIDDSVENRAEAERNIMADLRKFRRQLQARKATAPATASPYKVSSMMSRDPFATSFHTSSADPFTRVSMSHSTPYSAASKSSNASGVSLPSRKRSHSNLLGGDLASAGGSKSRRTSPTGYTTGPATPSTNSGYVSPLLDDGWLDLTADDDFNSYDFAFLERQREEEARMKREREDAAMALNLSQENRASNTPSNASSSSGLSAFDRISGIRPQASRPAAGPSGTNSISKNQGFAAYASQHRAGFNGHVKAESSANHGNGARPGAASQQMPGSYRDDSSDSEIELIDPSSWNDNGRHRGSSSFSSPSGPPSSALHMGLYGSKPMPSWLSARMNQPELGQLAAGSAYSSSQNAMLPPSNPSAYSNPYAYPAGSAYSNTNMYTAPPVDPLADILNRHNNQYSGELQDYFGGEYHDQLDYIMNDPRKTQQEIKELLENIKPDAGLKAEDREGTPDGLKYPLYEHQKIALTWLKAMEEGTNKGGILADDMGLGKTISSLALILSRPSTDKTRKTTLIVGPVALVRQWVREIQTKVNGSHKLSVHMMHGQAKKMSWDDLREFDIVLTTYGTLAAEFGRWEKYLHKLKLDGGQEVDVAASRKQFPLLGPKSTWYRVLLDEAQMIKNKNTKNAKAACQLKSLTRFCLTGTPMMNGVVELYSLIHFLRIRPYNEWTRFQQAFGVLTKASRGRHDMDNAMQKLQAVLKAILLRRTKTSLIDGKPIINLPPKIEEVQHVVFSDDEQNFYNALESKTKVQFNKYMKAGTVTKNYANILVLLLRLRQCCCHPHLIQDFEEAPLAGESSADTLIALAKSLAPEVVARLKGIEAFECPVCYDAVANPTIIIPCGHDTCSECMAKISDTAGQQNMANGEEGGPVTKCPTCRGRVEMNRVIDWSTFKKVHLPQPAIEGDEAAGNENSNSGSDSDSDTDSESESDEDEAGNLRGFIVNDDVEDEDEDLDDDETEDVKEPKPKKQKKKRSYKSKGKGKGKDKSTKHKSMAMLKKEASTSAAGRKKYMKALAKTWQPSAKVEKCVELLRKFQAENQKTIIFSQFVSLLDLLSVPIAREGWKCERYDGSMNPNARNQACIDFTDKPDCKIMLISLKAGNAGLNLVAASRVIILDPFWNPYIEMQAVDRAYRIGQQRSVEVHRILVENTVEDRIIELCDQKKKMVNAALDEGAQSSLGRLDTRQLAFLFGVGGG